MHPSLEALGFVPALAIAYAVATRPARREVALAAAALLLIFLAFVTPLQGWATHTFLWAHLLQNVVLAEWAPALLVLAVPRRLGARLHVPMLVVLPFWVVT
jgi:cytochrome c oxidase assembly factor CtaG